MDDLTVHTFRRFLRYESEIGHPPATLFFQEKHLKELGSEILAGLGALPYDIQLHSEARPEFIYVLSPKLMSLGYAHNLNKQISRLKAMNIEIRGHAPHALSNYLYWDHFTNHEIIVRATLLCGVQWMSEWHSICQTPKGAWFQAPLPPYSLRDGEKKLLVLPTSWDDRFLQQRPEDRYIFKVDSMKSYGEVQDSIRKQIDACRERNIPFIANIHPCNMLDANPLLQADAPDILGRIKRWLVKYASDQKIPLRTLDDIARNSRNQIMTEKQTCAE
jgi:hypothetical protein